MSMRRLFLVLAALILFGSAAALAEAWLGGAVHRRDASTVLAGFFVAAVLSLMAALLLRIAFCKSDPAEPHLGEQEDLSPNP
ncbi:hypothetical protein ACN2XU_01960 [Primorskyibacter sp. 2E107]|uniref:hypothetical protein n=1 Tax=Primorskyibacter sp. 2E107 TaxID=3403458 RepID=UPI003AF51794